MTKPRLVLLTCVFRRPDLTRMVLAAYRRMQVEIADELDLTLLAVGSEGRFSRDLCESQGFNYLEFPNSPLSHKWNAGVQAARDLDPDAVVILGSDDLLSAEIFRFHAGNVAAGVHFSGLRDLFFFDAASGELGYWAGYQGSGPEGRGEPIGCGRCYSSALLHRTGWTLWPRDPGYETLLDQVSLRYVGEMGFSPLSFTMDQIGGRAVDIKVGPNITSYDTYEYEKTWLGNRPGDFLEEWLSPGDLALLGLAEPSRTPS